MHNISLPPGVFGGNEVAGLFTNTLDYDSHPWLDRLRGLCVSAHFFIRRDGRIVQFVSTHKRAWHAGVSCFEDSERCNDFSIGIEMEEIGRASGRERVCQYVYISVVAVSLKKKKQQNHQHNLY